MSAAYEALPEAFRERIEGLKTVNVNVGRAAARPSPNGAALDKIKKATPYIHPLIRTHPDSGKKAIYYHDVKTDTIVGMTPDDTRELLKEISEIAIKPEFVYKHQWRVGDMLVIDNRQAVHRAYHDYDPGENREFLRILIEGDRPF